ncbi:hypothetical protein [Microbacterium sp.]|uniref:hypothetical protein n=1 Tax=Microbacterium sp. TaxID=51671 RepID=UPI00261EFDEA|nr:hypothetical protein [Microbacterium sp.]
MRWWRRQGLALIALVVAAVAAAGVHVWLDVLPSSEAEQPTVVDVERRGEIAGQTIAVDTVRWDEFDAPAGSRTLSVAMRSTGGADATRCGAFTLAEIEGSRVWLGAHRDVDVPSDAGEQSCLEESLSYDILAVFLLPDDATGPFSLTIPDLDDRMIRFVVEP